MFKKLGVLTTTLLLVPASMALAENAYNCDYSPSCEVAPGVYGAMASPVQSKFNLSVGGFVKLDYVHNTNDVGFLSPGAPGGAVANGSKDQSLFTARQSRFWLKAAGPSFLGAKTSALVEMDFYGTGQLSNEFGNLRMRHAYGAMDWTNTQVLFGQFWDVFGPAAADTIDFRQGGTTGAPSNPRVPQVRITQKIPLGAGNGLKIVVAAQNPTQDGGAADATMSKYGTGPGGTTFGSMVNFAGQAMFTSKLLGVSPGMMGLGLAPLQVGVFGLTGSMKLNTNKNDIDNYGYGAYAFVPILRSADGKHRTMALSLEAQIYEAAGLDVLGATNGLSSTNTTGLVGTAPNQSGAKGFGYYGQLKFYPTQDLGITAGHMARVSENRAQMSTNLEKRNQLTYANITYDLNAAVRLATEYEHQETTYGKLAAGAAPYGQNNAFRLAAYYFF